MSSSKTNKVTHQRRKRKEKHFLVMGDIEKEVTKIEKVTTDGSEFIHFDEMADGSWRLIYSGKTLNEEKSMRVVRETFL